MKKYHIITGNQKSDLGKYIHAYICDGEEKCFECNYEVPDCYLIKNLKTGGQLEAQPEVIDKKPFLHFFERQNRQLVFRENGIELCRLEYCSFWKRNIITPHGEYLLNISLYGIFSAKYSLPDYFDLKIVSCADKSSINVYSNEDFWTWVAVGVSYYYWI